MQAIARQPRRAHYDGAPVHYERHRPEQTTLYRLVQQRAQTFFAQTEQATGASLPQFVKDEFDAFLECGFLPPNRLLGRITIDDVVDLIRESSDRTMMQMAGLDDEADMFAPVLVSSHRRAVWLGINLVTAFLAAGAAGRAPRDHAPPA